jgi:hypothetical protein
VLYDLGLNDGSSYARWAAEKRESFGPTIGLRLAVKAALEELPPRELPKPDEESASVWEPEIARINARRASEGGGACPCLHYRATGLTSSRKIPQAASRST